MLRFTGAGASLQAQSSGGFSAGRQAGAGRSATNAAPDLANASTPSPLLAKLARLVRLTADDVARLESLSRGGTELSGEQLLIRQGEPATHIYLISEGLAFRMKALADGKRQILSYLIPGDVCGMRCSAPNRPDHDVVMIEGARVQRFELAVIADLVDRHPAIGRAFAMAALADQAIMREWLLNVGQRNSVQRLSHFFCEMSVRLAAVGKVDGDGSFALPLSQAALADTIGLTPVHINRTLQRLRTARLLELRQGRLRIIDREGLIEVAGFDENYLNIMRCED